MKNYLYKFFIFSASLIIGILIATNLSLGNGRKVFQLNLKEYKDASEERNNLYSEIDTLREDNQKIRSKIYSYQSDDVNHEKIVEDMKAQLKDYSIINGTTSITGPGIVIKIMDGVYSVTEDTKVEINRRTLHDIDAALVINELRSAGAEAIGLNQYRILGDAGVECNWAFIQFNDIDQSREAQPFYFYAIGDPDQLEAAIKAEGSHINTLQIRKLQIEIEKREEITLEPTSRILETQYMQRAD